MPSNDELNPPHCFICDKDLSSRSTMGEPMDALRFKTTGGYGSTAFDPNAFEIAYSLHIFICDECVTTRADRVELHRHHHPMPVADTITSWTP